MTLRRRPSRRLRGLVLTTLTGVSLLLLFVILFGQRGIRRYFALRAMLQQRSTQAYRDIIRNRALVEQLEGLRNDDRVLEEEARSRLGVVGNDEIVYVFPGVEPDDERGP